MSTVNQIKNSSLAIAFFFGLVLLGFFVYKGLKTFSDKDRVVTVKGLAEMNMKATSSNISLNFSYSGDDLQSVIKSTEDKKNDILGYLKTSGYSDKDIKVENVNINDRQRYYEYQWRGGQEVQVKIDRYTISQKITINAKDVEKTEDESSKMNLELISKGLTANVNTNYTFPELNEIKPQLIAESTKNARTAGEQFANDSHAKLGKIKTASQGQITIAGRYYYDEESTSIPQEPYLQKARVVSTIVFFLE